MRKKIAIVLFSTILLCVGKYVYDMNINHNFETITEGKVYKSGVIPPNEIESYVEKHKIKSIIDLRFPGTADLVNNPEIPTELTAEKLAVEKLKNVNYFNLGSDQVPKKHNLDAFFTVMDNPKNYPVLIHCYHGVGRAEMYSALFRIEYEGMSPNEARQKTRLITKFSSFDVGKPKGDYLINYKSRKQLESYK